MGWKNKGRGGGGGGGGGGVTVFMHVKKGGLSKSHASVKEWGM